MAAQCGAAALAGVAMAQSPADWIGPYVGADLGLRRSGLIDNRAVIAPHQFAGFTYPTAPASAEESPGGTIDNALVGGLRAGYLLSGGGFVYGLELQASLGRTSVSFDQSTANGYVANTCSVSTGCISSASDTVGIELTLDWIASLRARLGVPVSHDLMLSAFAGPALGGASLSLSQASSASSIRFFNGCGHPTLCFNSFAFSAGAEGGESRLLFGGTAGLAADYKLTGNWLLHGEIAGVLFQRIDAAIVRAGGATSFSGRPAMGSLAVGLTYRF